jgi:3-hydroxybutyryl-CoA dehydrogenase
MKVAAKGSPIQLNELQELLAEHEVVQFKSKNLSAYDVVFDLDFDDNPEFLPLYANAKDKVVFAGSVKLQLEEVIAELGAEPDCTLIGINSLPTFINRSLLECCVLHDAQKAIAEEKLSQLNIKPSFVASRLGMVTPRIVCMIINEAYYTIQEGTASREDIDLGMKLGTAYPKGPFEWVEEIGIGNVYETLDALYQDTRDERYKICSLLKTEYLKSFY